MKVDLRLALKSFSKFAKGLYSLSIGNPFQCYCGGFKPQIKKYETTNNKYQEISKELKKEIWIRK